MKICPKIDRGLELKYGLQFMTSETLNHLKQYAPMLLCYCTRKQLKLAAVLITNHG
jgi:hypothetical protein